MTSRTIDAITREWNNISTEQQRRLIHLYLTKHDITDSGQWMKFLKRQFAID